NATVAVCTPRLGPCIEDGIVSPNNTAERTTTDAKGRFRFSTMGPYVYSLRVSDARTEGEHQVDPRQRFGPWAVTVRVNLPTWSSLRPAPRPED
ncbi:hypothetical protein LCGC14_2573570, partial [marine sediment metagenome]